MSNALTAASVTRLSAMSTSLMTLAARYLQTMHLLSIEAPVGNSLVSVGLYCLDRGLKIEVDISVVKHKHLFAMNPV